MEPRAQTQIDGGNTQQRNSMQRQPNVEYTRVTATTKNKRMEEPIPSQVAHIVELAMIYKVSLDAFVQF